MEKELNISEEEYPEREIKFIIIHCTATRCDTPFTPAQLEQAHKARGLHGTGYHFYITRDGVLHHTRPIYRIGVHTSGFNLHSIGICYEGGLSPEGQPQDTRTTFQCMALLDLIGILKKQYPKARIMGHYQLSTDTRMLCPCFEPEKEYGNL